MTTTTTPTTRTAGTDTAHRCQQCGAGFGAQCRAACDTWQATEPTALPAGTTTHPSDLAVAAVSAAATRQALAPLLIGQPADVLVRAASLLSLHTGEEGPTPMACALRALRAAARVAVGI